MTRKITTILLALALCLTLLPVGAGAAGTTSPSGTDLGEYLNNRSTDSPESVTWDYDSVRPYSPRTIEITGYVLNGGTYYLGNDVTIDKPLIIKGGTEENPVTLDLKGHVLKLNSSIYSGTATGSVIVVKDGAYFVLKDTSTPSDIHHFTKNDAGLYTLSEDTSSPITLTGGVITGGTGTDVSGDSSSVFGGGVFVGSTANFKMTGGNIVGCAVAGTNAHGGGVFVAAGKNDTMHSINNAPTKFTMTGGSIVGCTAASTGTYSAYGGGVYVRGCAEFTMDNARITNCTANTAGGGVYTDGEFTMESGTIENCTATGDGGGVRIDSYGTFTMKGGTIKGCAAANGGGVYIKNTMNAQGGSVHGGVYICSGYTLKNTSAEGSTIFYPDKNGNAIVKEGGNATIIGKQVKFMNGTTLYAETVANTNGKISQPVAPTHPTDTNKGFDVWYSKNGNAYQKVEFTDGAALVPAGDTLYAFWEGDFDNFEVYVSGADNPATNGYYETFAEAWSGVNGESATFKLLKSVIHSINDCYKRTLDLNGFTFTGDTSIPAGTSAMPKSFTVTDTSSGKNGTFDGTITVAKNNAQLKVEGGTVENVVVGSGGTLDCIGGKITNLDVSGGTVNHIGGTASCKELAKCSVCHQPYGVTNPANHVGTLGSYQYNKDGHWQVYSCCETATAKVAHDFDGSKCSVCGYEKPRRVYRGSTAPTISAVLSHPDAASATNYTSGIYGLTFRSTASFASFRGVQVDGKTIASTNYIAEEGSIVVYLKAVYLQTLPNGTHTVTILSTEGNATMNFTIGGVQSAKTADAGVAIYAVMALTSYTGTALVVRGRKRK